MKIPQYNGVQYNITMHKLETHLSDSVQQKHNIIKCGIYWNTVVLD